MHRSLGFGSHIFGLSRSHFAFARPTISLANPLYKRYAIFSMTALVSMIFGSLSLQPCLSFHLSLTLLFLYRCSFVFSLRGLVPLSSNFALMFYSSLPFAPFTGLSYPLCLLYLRRFFDSSCLARHYYTYLSWFLFLQLLRCFSSLGFSLFRFPSSDSLASSFLH